MTLVQALFRDWTYIYTLHGCVIILYYYDNFRKMTFKSLKRKKKEKERAAICSGKELLGYQYTLVFPRFPTFYLGHHVGVLPIYRFYIISF